MAPVNPPTFIQASTYSARLDRLSAAGMMMPEHGTGALAPRGGVRPTPSNTGLQATQRASPGMWVTAAAGVGYVPAQSATGGMYTVYNDAAYDVAITAAHATLARKDLIIARVYDAEYSGASNTMTLEVVNGTAAGSPVLPSTPAGAIALAQVQVNAAATQILNASITDLRTYTTALGGTIPCLSTARPATPYEGMTVYETNNNLPKWYNGSAWTGWQDEGYLNTSGVASYLSSNSYVTTGYLTSGNYLTQSDVAAWDWTSYTPTWSAATTAPSVGNGTLTPAYRLIGKTAFVRIKLVMGSTTGKGTGLYGFTLPPSAAPTDTQALAGFISNSAGTARYVITGFLTPGSGVFRIALGDGSSGVSNTVPIAWATGDQLVMSGSYQIS